MASYLFIATIVLLLAASSLSPSHAALCNKEDKKALESIRSWFGSSVFLSWTNITGCCDWYGVDCNAATGRVTGLSILQISASATIPPAIADLTELQVLRIHKLPNLHGPIPPELATLTHLRFLTISWTSVSGQVPEVLSKLTALEQLDLSFNMLSGSIPASLGDLHALYAIDISRNLLTGTIPATLFNKPPSPPYLLLSHNSLTGTIPPAFSNVDFLQFDVSRNQLVGDASFLFGKSKSTNLIDLSRNQFEFDLSKVEFPTSNLDVFSMDHNMIYGSIPVEITQVPTLQFLNVSYNRLCGEIPAGGQLGRFDQYCFFHNKCLCGPPLPPCN